MMVVAVQGAPASRVLVVVPLHGIIRIDYPTEYGNRGSVPHSDVAPSQFCSTC